MYKLISFFLLVAVAVTLMFACKTKTINPDRPDLVAIGSPLLVSM